MNNENYYQILGVEETASQDEIKKVYRKLAKENHPDKGGDEELFKKISVAYDILGDESKRKDYDMRRKNPFGGGGMEDIFQQMFNQTFGNRTKQQRVHDTVITTNLSVIDSYMASEKEITYKRKIKCDPCNGSGGDKKTCPTCNGQGHLVKQMGSGMFVQLVQVACNQCMGLGEIIINPCYNCHGSGTKEEIKKVNIKLPHGIDDGQFIRLQGIGDFKNGTYGNLVVRVNLTYDGVFEKIGHNLVYNAFFNLEDLKKEVFTIPHPDGELVIKFPKQFDTTKPLRLKSKGFKNEIIGDLLVNQHVKFERD